MANYDAPGRSSRRQQPHHSPGQQNYQHPHHRLSMVSAGHGFPPQFPAHVASWVQSTPLPMALAHPSSSSSDTASVYSHTSKASKRKSKRKERKEEVPLIIAPGRSARASAMPMPLNLTSDEAIGPINPSGLLDQQGTLPLNVPAAIVGRAGLVRDRDGLVYNPENPRRSMYSGEDGRATRISGAVSAKQAKAIRQRAADEQDYEDEERRRKVMERMAKDESDEERDRKVSESEDEDETRVVFRLPKNYVGGDLTHKNRFSRPGFNDESDSESDQEPVTGIKLDVSQKNLMKVGGKVTAIVPAESAAQAARDFLFMGPGRRRAEPAAVLSPANRKEIDSGEDSEDSGRDSRRKTAQMDPNAILKPGRGPKPRDPLDDELPANIVSSDEEDDIPAGLNEVDDFEADLDEEDDVPLQARMSQMPNPAAVANQLNTLDISGDAEPKSSAVTSPKSKTEGDGEKMTIEELTTKMEDMRRRCKQAREDPIAAMAASKFIIENVRHMDGDVIAQKYLCNLAVRALRKVGISNQLSPEISAESQHLLANLHDRHKPDYTKAFQLYASAAKKGHADALFHVGLCYEQGAGVALSNPKALHNYKKSARMNHPGAMFRIGMSLIRGELGQGVSIRDAFKWLKLSAKYADEQYPHALYELAMLHENPIDKNIVFVDREYVVELLTKGAELGHGLCQYKLGEAFEYGMYNCGVDPGRSVYYYSLAAANGQTEAMFELGGWYLTGADDPRSGYKLPQSDPDARKWVSLAAEAGLPRAMFAMGYFEEHGIGDPEGPDPDESLRWYRRAADEGDEKAIKRLEEKGVAWKKEKDKRTFVSMMGGASGSGSGKSVQLGSFAPPKTAAKSKRAHMDEELDGGNKCLVM
ncbi:hypothetical protein BC829DRAFT_407735 [Chytridium lagenaria]|nr:hypothetical protein BC829DRAFT_407735 [Chytridium lagenaria]